MTQVIDKQGKSYTILINDITCTFIPMSLYLGNNLIPIKSFVRSSKAILYWKVNGKQVSYNQIKKAILKYKKQ